MSVLLNAYGFLGEVPGSWLADQRAYEFYDLTDTVILLCQGDWIVIFSCQRGWSVFLAQGHVKHFFLHTFTYTNGIRHADLQIFTALIGRESCLKAVLFCID